MRQSSDMLICNQVQDRNRETNSKSIDVSAGSVHVKISDVNFQTFPIFGDRYREVRQKRKKNSGRRANFEHILKKHGYIKLKSIACETPTRDTSLGAPQQLIRRKQETNSRMKSENEIP